MTTLSATRTQSTRSTANAERAASNPNAILSQYQPTGASSATARQDGLSAGVAASQKMARTDLPKIKQYADEFAAAGQKYGVPPALLAAIASRESRGGSALDSRGFGDHGNGFGLMQVDKRYHTPKGGPFSAAHIDQAASILKSSLTQIKKAHPDWPPEQQLRGAVAAYNSGVGNVRTIKNMDVGTTGNDYSNDVWARAQALAPSFGGNAGGSAAPSGGTGPSRPSGSNPASSAPTLKEGNRGQSVKSVQGQLEKLGFELGAQDGIFGPKTEQAVKRFQTQHHLKADGIVGPKTHAALEKALAQAAKPATADTFEGGKTQWKDAPALADVQSGKTHLQQGMEGGSVRHVQDLLGIEADGKFGPDTQRAVAHFQREHKLDAGSGMGTVGPKTLEAMEKAAKSGGPGEVLGNGVRINTNHPVLKKLATSHLNNGPTGYCVRTTLDNMQRLGVPNTPAATGNDPNNPRGGMAQMLRNGWESIPFPGARQQAIRSPYGNATANVVTADQYRKLVADGKVPDGAIIFQTRHGWDYSGGSKGNDMGVVRNNGRTTHNYQDMNSIIYRDCKDVVILVPKGAIQRD